jgi:hypothetical protein
VTLVPRHTSDIHLVLRIGYNHAVVGEPDSIDVQSFIWDFSPDGNVDHLARHSVTPEDVEALLESDPLFFRSPPSRRSTHAMIGRDGRGRSLIVYLLGSADPSIWEPVTGWQSKIAHRLLEEEGRLNDQ